MLLKLDQIFTRTRRRQFFTRLDLFQFLLCILIIGLHLLLLRTGAIDRIENAFLDYFFRERPAPLIHPSIAVIEIDQESIQAVGAWPWPWSYHAEIVDLLREWQARAIVFDMMFDESESPSSDGTLEGALEKTERDYLPVALNPKSAKKIWVHSLPIVLEPQGEKKVWTHSARALERHVKALGHVNVAPDADGIVRRIHPGLDYEPETHPHLALRVAYDFLGEPLPKDLGVALPLDERGRLLIAWAGRWRKGFAHFSYADLVRSSHALRQGQKPVIRPGRLKGKICLIGLSAPGLAPFLATPLESTYPSFGIHAQVMNSILTGRFVRPASLGQNALCLSAIGLVASFLFVVFRTVRSFLAGLALGGVWLVLSFLFFWQKGVWFTTAHPLFLILSLFIFSALYDHFIASKERSRLFDLATRDGLTGLFVIRHFRDTLNEAVTEAGEGKKPLSLVLIDIDNFKLINDTHGHPAGDMVLKQTAHVIYSCFRSKRPIHETDFVARYGGEEFIVMLRNANLRDVALKVAERIRKAVEETRFEWEGKLIPVTVSLGVATLHPGEKVPDLMVRRADEALYHAKRHGKNRVSIEDVTAG